MTDERVQRCIICDKETTRPALTASIEHEDVACVCELHGVGLDAYTYAPAVVNRLILLVGQDHPDCRIRIRDSAGRYIHPPRHP